MWQLHDKLQMAVTVCRIWRKILLYNKDTRRYLHIFSYKMLYRTAFVSSCVEVFQLLGAILENQWSHLRLFEPQYFSNQFPFPVGGSKKSSSWWHNIFITYDKQPETLSNLWWIYIYLPWRHLISPNYRRNVILFITSLKICYNKNKPEKGLYFII